MAAARSCISVLLHKTPREASLYYYDYKPRAAEGNAAQGEAVHIGHFNGKCVCLYVCNRGDTLQYHGGLRSRELGQAPMLLVFLTPRQALSSHPRQQMV